MKKTVALMLALLLAVIFLPGLYARGEGVEISAPSAVLMEAGTGPALMSDMQGILDAAGIKGSAGLEEGKMVIYVQEYLGITEAEAHKVVGRMMPAGVRWEIRAG